MTELLRLLDITGLRLRFLLERTYTQIPLFRCARCLLPSYLSVEAELGTPEREFLRV